MDDRFGSWMRDAMAEMDEEILEKRWNGVAELAEGLDHTEILEMIIFCALGRVRNPETIEKAKTAFWDHDNAFDKENSNLALIKLCGAVVMHRLDAYEGDELDFCLVISNLSLGGLQAFGLPDLAEDGENRLQQLSVDIRDSAKLTKIPKKLTVKAKGQDKVKAFIEANQPNEALTELDTILQEHARTINNLGADNALLRSALGSQAEETNILWWLMGAYSDDLKQPFSQIETPIAALVAGKELADQIDFRPGPLGAVSLLSRIVQLSKGKEKKISLKQLIVKVPIEWRKKLIEQADVITLELCPLLAAFSASVELDDDDGWVKLFAKKFPISTDELIPIDLLALQSYREQMLGLEIANWT